MANAVQKTIRVPCQSENLNDVRRLIEESLSSTSLDRREKDRIVLAVDEAVSSVVQYAKFKGYKHEVTLTIDVNDARFKALLNDSLNVFEQPVSQTAAQLGKERSFTLGIFLMRQIMDEITYTYKKGFENQLELIYFL